MTRERLFRFPKAALAAALVVAPITPAAASPQPSASTFRDGLSARAERGAPEAADSASLLLRDAVLIDGTGAAPVEGVDVRVREGKIVRVSTTDLEPGPDETVLDLEGRYLLPGLVDAHVHVSTIGQARRALRSGVTTMRSAGVDHFADVGLRELAAAGAAEIPEIVAAGYHVRPRPSEAFFLDEPAVADLRASGVRTASVIRRMVRAMSDHEVDFVKVNATARAGLPDTDPRKPFYDLERLTALVEAASGAGLPVMAHAHGDEGARAAVEAGVRSIEHGTYMSASTLRAMLERETYYVPTIAVVEDLTRPGGDYDIPFLQVRGKHMLPRVRETARRAHEIGVPLVAATDTGYGPESVLRLGHELEEFVGLGLTRMEAVRSATSVAAELLGVDDHTGVVAEGMDADLVVVDRSPLEDIRHLQDVLVVVVDGRLAVNRIEW